MTTEASRGSTTTNAFITFILKNNIIQIKIIFFKFFVDESWLIVICMHQIYQIAIFSLRIYRQPYNNDGKILIRSALNAKDLHYFVIIKRDSG